MREIFTESKSATLTVVNGASYVKVAKPKKKRITDELEEVKVKKLLSETEKEKSRYKGGSQIIKFSKVARRNMMYTLSKIRRDCLPSFVTLTYPSKFSESPEVWKNDLHLFIKRLQRRFPDVAGIWKLEPQRRGAPHYHLLLWNQSLGALQEFIPFSWNEVVGNGDVDHLRWHLGKLNNGNIHCVQEVHTQKQMYQYVLKYVSKSSLEGWEKVGKWWGVLGRDFLPLGDEVVFEITDQNADDIIRYMRRFTRMGSGMALQSRQQVCDADQWMEKLQTIPMMSYREWLQLPQVKEVSRNVSV